MCRAVTCLSYCIAVTTKSLLFAADAQSTLEPTLRFLDLVSLRTEQGTLKARLPRPLELKASIVEQLPVQVWALIRRELVNLELERAEQRIADSLTCGDCRWEMDEAGEVPRWNFPDFPEARHCYACWEFGEDFEGIKQTRLSTLISQLLRPFGLTLPACVPVIDYVFRDERPPPLLADSRTAVFISLKPAQGSRPLASSTSAGEWDERDEQGVFDVSFALPPGADQRFHRLVSQYHLQPVRITDGTVVVAGTSDYENSPTPLFGKRVFQRDSTPRPQWKLFSACETTWN
ncbi:hypothetical protein NBRC10512_002238 [Rhodotorula toruloides]|uniref:RHTO0S02e09802g1_1 n=2 Tax=Rhodotorula toruloides TaxID=5286 RepID=A0A061AHI1_RHOTO|nr:uncharacterized protein RHTO_07339 [Rhodotorula toruloides NP11]EMS23605.1 hypothetical protein RHTO_07339 [Rhodotorula toruloides NP11]CDR37019.1 RHTO0S02e09802g1_1 [Rhodotorula toruloides]